MESAGSAIHGDAIFRAGVGGELLFEFLDLWTDAQAPRSQDFDNTADFCFSDIRLG